MTTGTGPQRMMVGASVVEVPVPNGTLMAGFAARDEPSAGVNDPLTVRALVIEDACWITVDVCGLDEATAAASSMVRGLHSAGSSSAPRTRIRDRARCPPASAD